MSTSSRAVADRLKSKDVMVSVQASRMRRAEASVGGGDGRDVLVGVDGEVDFGVDRAEPTEDCFGEG